jgi:small conductance mechanosensitive channel
MQRLFSFPPARLACWVLFFFLAAFGGASLAAATPAPVEPPRHPVSTPSAAAEIGQQIQALVTGEEGGEIEPQETFGTRALGVLLSSFNLLRQEGLGFVTDFAALPQLGSWLAQQTSDKNAIARWAVIAERLVLVVGGAFLAGWIASLLFLPLRRRVKRHEPALLSGRVVALVVWFFLSLIPVIVFLATAIALMDPSDAMKLVRYFVMTVVYALAIFQIIRLVSRFLFAPRTPSLRLVPLTTRQAAYAHRWISALSAVMVVGWFGGDLARLVRVPVIVVAAFNNMIALVVVLMTIVVIVQKRAFVSSFLRGEPSVPGVPASAWQGLRTGFARIWHVVAISYIVIGYLVTALGASGGFQILQRGTILSLLTLLVMRLGLHLVAKITRPSAERSAAVLSAGIYKPVLQILLRLAIWALGIAGILAAWGADVGGFVMSAWGQRILGSVFSITSTIVLVVLIYEALHIAIERNLHHRDAAGHITGVNPRAQTLLPMLRNAAIIVLAVIVGLVTLSELGINIGPLLAGAGVLGVAIGFGSQTLVKDFLTGLFIILEDNIAVGDVVQIGDNSGVVESMTIRTVRLRDVQGSLHILPFSEITKIVNLTKGYSFALIEIGVAYDTKLERAMDVMKEVGESLRVDPAFADSLLEPLEMQGVETLGDSSITLRCRLKTKPGKQWDVRRAYLLRVKEAFDAAGVVIPFPTTVTQIQKIES